MENQLENNRVDIKAKAEYGIPGREDSNRVVSLHEQYLHAAAIQQGYVIGEVCHSFIFSIFY